MPSSRYTRFSPVGRKSTNGGMFPFWKGQAKRTAKRKEWVSFLRETRVEAQACDHTTRLWQRQAEDEQQAQWLDKTREAVREQAVKDAAHERFLERLGENATFWAVDPRNPDTWTLEQVQWDESGWDNYCCYECNGGPPPPSWTTVAVAQVSIDRCAMQWVISTPSWRGDPAESRLEYEHHSLDQVQELACVLVTLTHQPA